MSTPAATQISERETVHDYVLDRAVTAFKEGDDDQAFIMHRFAEALAEMSDAEYEVKYPEGDGDIA